MKSNEPTQMINTVNKMLAQKYLLEWNVYKTDL